MCLIFLHGLSHRHLLLAGSGGHIAVVDFFVVVATGFPVAVDFPGVVDSADLAADVPAAEEQVAVGDWKHYDDTRNFC